MLYADFFLLGGGGSNFFYLNFSWKFPPKIWSFLEYLKFSTGVYCYMSIMILAFFFWQFRPKFWYSPNWLGFDTVTLSYAGYYFYIAFQYFLHLIFWRYIWARNLLFSRLTYLGGLLFHRVTFSSVDYEINIYFSIIFPHKFIDKFGLSKLCSQNLSTGVHLCMLMTILVFLSSKFLPFKLFWTDFVSKSNRLKLDTRLLQLLHVEFFLS